MMMIWFLKQLINESVPRLFLAVVIARYFYHHKSLTRYK